MRLGGEAKMHNHTGLLRPETHELMMKGMYQLLHAIYLCSSQSLCKLPARGYEYTHSPAQPIIRRALRVCTFIFPWCHLV